MDSAGEGHKILQNKLQTKWFILACSHLSNNSIKQETIQLEYQLENDQIIYIYIWKNILNEQPKREPKHC